MSGANAATSLKYLTDIVEEVREPEIPESCWEPLCVKVTRMERLWLQANPATQ